MFVEGLNTSPFPSRVTFLLGLLAVLLCPSCRTIPPFPPADFTAPGWRVHHGQAIWKPANSKPELVGELLLATNASGDFFVEFTKTPFTLVTVRGNGGRWQIEFPWGEYTRRGTGEPPERFVWFELPRYLGGAKAAGGWEFSRAGEFWRIENARTGERLEGRFFP